MIITVKPMSAEHARALEMAYELQRVLEELAEHPDHGPGSCVEQAWNDMVNVVGMLEPDEPDEPDEEDDRPPPRLRIVAGKDGQP